MPEINLLQNRLQDTTYVSTRRTQVVVYLSGFLLLLICGAGVALFTLTKDINAETAEVLKNNMDLQKELTEGNLRLTDATAYQAKLSNINTLLSKHILISPLLAELEQYTYLKARFTNLDVDQLTGHLHVEGVVDSYQGLGKLLLAFSTSPNFKDVKLLSVTPTDGGYTFGIDMSAKSELFNIKK